VPQVVRPQRQRRGDLRGRQSQRASLLPGERSQVRVAHCPGRPLQRQGRSLRSRRQGDGRKRPPLTPETSAAPAGLTARARPEARPEARAANAFRPGTYQEEGEETNDTRRDVGTTLAGLRWRYTAISCGQ
jgi:hypothetical protein